MPFFSALGSLWDFLRPNRPPAGKPASRVDGDGPEPASKVRSRIESVGADPSDRVDELRARLSFLSTACLSMAPVLIVLTGLEHLHGASFTVVACLLVVCVLSGAGGTLFYLAPAFRCGVTQ
ncbi:hypothetical protein BBK36DRAFT_1582 [Trichoderma citrinoviride]|uniref:Uncharacterized protein n=1 Tax=Trichoderma citrinoviride TaxID=58853 RepID=A0A2T4BKT3_9HYPO|nr:hypothetical protein BBK36DRAFT_1582 [Trichoderma citrinoviride]PTB69928.1 hypothetical protein BBK36DRAFT_1582 [Trichoderma citrinoviride]